ncbi:MAG TPA: polyhydroxyalkanoate synthesis regulator DNA-binding domain-containing protein [Acidimicrobiia bacterium]
MAEPVRLIKRYANRKLYDTGSGELTSLRRIEELVRDGVDIRVVDHDTGEDMTSEVLVGILGASMHDGTIAGDTLLLTSLIRTPNDLLSAMMADEQRTEELRSMGERVRLLSATIDALLGQMDQGGDEPGADERPKPAPRKRTGPAKARS